MRNLQWEDNINWPGRNINIPVYQEPNAAYTISASVSREMLNEPKWQKDYGINLKAYMQNALYGEAVSYIGKKISQSVLSMNINGTELYDDCSLEKAISVIKKVNDGFVLTNVRIGVALQDTRDYKMIATSKMADTIAEQIYQIGYLNGIPVWVDPHLEWNYPGLGINLNKFYNFSIGEEMHELNHLATFHADPQWVQHIWYNYTTPDNIICQINPETIKI